MLPLSEKWVSALFVKLQVRYGHKWTSSMPTEELILIGVKEWSMHLSGVTGDQIRHGLENLNCVWPPSVAEFKKLCEGDKNHKTGAYNLYNKPKKINVNTKKAYFYIQEMKKLLR